MHLSLIVAMDKHGLIGNEKGLPWHLPADLKRFCKLTTGKPIIMGRKTLDHIGRALPDRLNIVVTRQRDFKFPGVEVVFSFNEALKRAEAALPQLGADEIMVVGGAEIFRAALPIADRIYLTIVAGDFTGNTIFPQDSAFRGDVIHDERLPADARDHAHRFMIVDRKQNGMALAELMTV